MALTKDDLPSVTISPLRKAGIVRPEMRAVEIAFRAEGGEQKVEVGLWHMQFPNHGGWSYFVCPSCRHPARTLRWLDGRALCWRCDGLLRRSQVRDPHWPEERIERLRKALSEGQLSKARLRISLRRALMVAARKGLKRADFEDGQDQAHRPPGLGARRRKGAEDERR